MKYSYLVTALLILLLWSCRSNLSTQPERRQDTGYSQAAIEQLNWMKASELYVDGRDFERRGEYQKAYEAYKISWKLDSTSEYLTNYLIDLSLLAKQPGEALYFITKGEKVSELPDSTLRKVVEIYSRFQNYTQALYVADELDSMGLQDSMVYATLLEKDERYLEAASYIESLLKAPDDVDSISNLKNLTETNITLKIATLMQKADMPDSAMQLFQSVLEKEPDNLNAKRGLGMTLFSMEKELEKGRDLLEEVYGASSKNGVPDIISAELLAKYYAQTEQWDTAIERILPVYAFYKTKQHQGYTLYYGKMLALYYVLGNRVEVAEKHINDLISIADGSDYEVLLYSAMLHSNKGEIEKAKALYHEIISLNDKVVPAYRSLIGLLVDEKKIDEAIIIAKLFTEKVPDTVLSHAILGQLYTGKGDFTSAIPPLEKAVALNPNSNSNLFELGMAYERSGVLSKAIPIFEKLVEVDSTNSVWTNYLGYVLADQGVRLEEAERLISLALEQAPDNGAYLDSYGWVFYKLRKYDKAEKYLLLALEKIQNDYVIYYHLGDLYAVIEQYEKALMYYQKAAEFKDNPDSESIAYKIMRLQQILGGSDNNE